MRNLEAMESDRAILFQQIRSAFSASNSALSYGRDKERKRISEFISSKERTLHISGVPGTGKTSTVLSVLNGTDFIYFNYLIEKNIAESLRESNHKIKVIDEFDKFYKERRNECKRILLSILKSNIKLITISNTRFMVGLDFKPYTTEEITAILKYKIKEEIGREIASEKTIMAMAKKYGKHGDMRMVMKEILSLIIEKIVNGSKVYLEIEDLANNKIKESNTSIHYELILKAAKESGTFIELYKIYIKECKRIALPYLGRNDAEKVYELTQN